MHKPRVIEEIRLADRWPSDHPFSLREFDEVGAVAAMAEASSGLLDPAPLLSRASYQAWSTRLETLGADQACLENLESLAGGEARCIVTGQQTGYLGGPNYTALKAMGAVRIAERVHARIPCVPVFWVLGEDHDIAEANAIGCLQRNGEPLQLSIDGIDDHQPIGRVPLDHDRALKMLGHIRELTGSVPVKPDVMEETLLASQTWGEAFTRLLLRMTRGTGLVPFITDLPEVKRDLLPFFQRVVEQSSELVAMVNDTGERLAQDGLRRQITKQPNDAAFFLIEGRRREKVTATEAGFEAEARSWSIEEMKAYLAATPERFSANVISNPVMMRAALPTVGLVLGPGELAYHAQLEEVYPALGWPQPVRLPRPGATLLKPKTARHFEERGLRWRDLAGDFHALVKERVTADHPAVDDDFWREKLREEEALLDNIEGQFTANEVLDFSLDRTFRSFRQKNLNRLEWLQKKATQAVKRASSEEIARLKALSNATFPGGQPQERFVSVAVFLQLYGPEYASDLLQLPLRLGHHYLVSMEQESP